MRKNGSADARKPILVLGLGNTLLRDDGIGPFLVSQLATQCNHPGDVDFLDGGTQGIALLQHLTGRDALLILDAFSTGAAPGSLHIIRHGTPDIAGWANGRTSHEGNASGLLAAAALTGDLPPRVYILGVEPQWIDTGVTFSPAVAAMAPAALESAAQLLEDLRTQPRSVAQCA